MAVLPEAGINRGVNVSQTRTGAQLMKIGSSLAIRQGRFDTPPNMSSGTGYFMRWFKQQARKGVSRFANFSKHPARLASATFLLTLGVNALGTMKSHLKYRSEIEKPSSLRMGPGFMTWSKVQGMPANHLSTDGLSLALSKTRHVSLI